MQHAATSKPYPPWVKTVKRNLKAEFDAEQLVRVTFWQSTFHEHEALRPLGDGEQVSDVIMQRGQIDALRVGFHHNDDADGLLQRLMWRRERRTASDAGMACDGLFDLHGADDLAAAVDDLLGPACDVQVPIFVEVSEVAGVEPA